MRVLFLVLLLAAVSAGASSADVPSGDVMSPDAGGAAEPAAVAPAVQPAAAPLKCPERVRMPGYEADEPVVLIDGRVVRLAEFEAMTPDEVHSIHVTCWSPSHNAFGDSEGVPVLQVTTVALMEETAAPLHMLVSAHRTYMNRFGHHARSLEDLYEQGLPREPALDFAASQEGWRASTPDGLVSARCSAGFDRSGGHPEVHCDVADGAALDALEKRYRSPGH